MSRIPNELLRDADRCPDPWADLCSNRFIPRGFHDLFRACASVLPAAIRLARKVYSRGDLVERAKRGGSEAECEALNRKLFPAMWRADAGLLREAAAHKGPVWSHEFEEREARLVEIIAKKRGKAAAAARPRKLTADPLRDKWPLLYLMLTNWLRCGHFADVGLMFYSDSALADLFSLLNWRGFDVVAEDLDSEQIEKMRGRLGLRKAKEKLPLVTGARMDHKTGVIELNTHDAKTAKYEWPKYPLQLRCRVELSGQLLYRGATS
jgi:hypothetical protein